jgi:hypothetical protein
LEGWRLNHTSGLSLFSTVPLSAAVEVAAEVSVDVLSVDVAALEALDALLPQAARLKVIAAAKVNANVFFIMVLLLYRSGCFFRSRSLLLWYSKTGGKARRILTKIVAEFCTCLTYCNIFVFCFCMLRPFRLHFSCNAMSQCCTRISYIPPGSRVSCMFPHHLHINIQYYA